MTWSVRVSLVTLAAALSMMAVASAGAQNAAPGAPAPNAAGAAAPSEPPKWMRHWADDRAAMLDARLAGLKAGLRLRPDQEALWAPFETAVRGFAESRMAHMQQMMQFAEREEEGMSGPSPSPIDRLDMMATRLANAGAALKKIADAAKPLYASLDDQQKRMFGFLSHEMMRMGHGHMGHMGHMGGSGDDEGDDE